MVALYEQASCYDGKLVTYLTDFMHIMAELLGVMPVMIRDPKAAGHNITGDQPILATISYHLSYARPTSFNP